MGKGHPEISARLHNRTRIMEAHDRAQQAIAQARTCLRLTVQMAASAVNDELDHVPNAQAVARACLLREDIDATCTAVEQYLEDLVFQPLQLLTREADCHTP